MTQPTQPSEKVAWVRVEVPEQVHLLAHYIKERCGMPNVPTAWRFLLCWQFYGKNFEDVAQELAADAGWVLPPLELEPPSSGEKPELPPD